VSAAFSILSDADKRASYDRYGETDGNTGGGSTAETRRSQHYAQYEQEISPEDLFNMFFGFGGGGGMGGGMGGGFGTVYTSDGRVFRTGGAPARPRRPRTPEEEERAAAGQRMAGLMQLLPLILMVVFMLFTFQGSGGGAEPLYNLVETQEYKVERRTSVAHVTPRLPYYVKDDFMTRLRHDRTLLARIESQVETDLYTQLQAKCSQETTKKRVLQQQLSVTRDDSKRDSLTRALQQLPTPGCDAFKTYFPSHAGA